jgi:hypothetical protein
MARQRKNHRELDEFERVLAALTPRGGGVNRDRLMYLAGQASVQRSSGPEERTSWYWPASTALSTAAAVLMGLLLFHGPNRSSTDSVAGQGPPKARPQSVERRPESPADQRSIPLMPRREPLARGDSAPALEAPETARDWAHFVRTRRTALTRGLDAIQELEVPSPQDRVVASTYWGESKRLLPRQSTQDSHEVSRNRLPSWQDFFMTGENL